MHTVKYAYFNFNSIAIAKEWFISKITLPVDTNPVISVLTNSALFTQRLFYFMSVNCFMDE